MAAAATLLAFCGSVLAAADGSRVPLPAGVDLAIVVFEDLQCPDCRRAHPDLVAAAKSENVPLLVRDFPITRHAWAFPAAVLARYFEARSPRLGMEFREFIFQNQPGIGVENLREFGERFAASHGLALPADVDPDGSLAALVQADFDLGREIHLEYVPLMFVISRRGGETRAVEVTDSRDVATALRKAKDGR